MNRSADLLFLGKDGGRRTVCHASVLGSSACVLGMWGQEVQDNLDGPSWTSTALASTEP